MVRYSAKGELEEEQEFKDGVEDGMHKKYDRSGNLTYDCYYKNGKPHGKQTIKYIDGEGFETVESEYDNGKPVGRFVRTLTSGVVTSEGQYDGNNEKTGL